VIRHSAHHPRSAGLVRSYQCGSRNIKRRAGRADGICWKKRKAGAGGEGAFAPETQTPLPYLPEVIGW